MRLGSPIVAVSLVAACLLGGGCSSFARGGSYGDSAARPAAAAPPEEPAVAGDSVPDGALAEGEPVPEHAPLPEVLEEPASEPAPPEASTHEDDPEALLAGSLEAFESAQAFWEEGNYDDSLAALDQAYELMAAVPVNGDASVSEEKEELRRLIARRIVEVYASRRTAVGEINDSIPLVLNDYVQREIASFQNGEREFFEQAYRRSGLYRPMIVAELRKAGLPEQLSWVPLVESGFKVRAYSRARALGLWQFIASTGFRFGLKRDYWVDERMDPVKSTRAAIAYMEELHGLFGDWMTAVAAYNCGEHAVLRQIRRQPVSYFDEFWDLYSRLPRETRRHVPRLLAVLTIVENPPAYGFDDLPEPLPPLELETVRVDQSFDLAALEASLELPKGTLEDLNAELRRRATPPEPYDLRIPGGGDLDVTTALGELPTSAVVAGGGGVHRVRRGETLSQVAAAYRTSVADLVALNNLRSPDRIWPGQQLQVPGGAAPVSSPAAGGGAVRNVRYTVTTGDTLWNIAKRYGTTVDRIRGDNGLRGNLLRVGQELLVRTGRTSDARRYTVRRGDTLDAIAKAHGVTLSSVMSANNLGRRSTIYPGQTLVIPR